jgi:hypothetical protein
MKVGTGSLVLCGPTLLHLTSTCCVWGPPQFASDDGRIGGGGGGQDGPLEPFWAKKLGCARLSMMSRLWTQQPTTT